MAARLAHFRVPLAFRQYIRYCHFLLLICFHRKLTLTFHCPALHHRRPTRSVTWLVSVCHETYQEIVYGNLDRTGQANHKTLKMNKKNQKRGTFMLFCLQYHPQRYIQLPAHLPSHLVLVLRVVLSSLLKNVFKMFIIIVIILFVFCFVH